MKDDVQLPSLKKVNQIIHSIEGVRHDPRVDPDKFSHVYAEAIILRARITSKQEIKNGNHNH